jgi:hypothetical protein
MAAQRVQQSSDITSKQWVRRTQTMSAHTTMMCVESEDDVSDAMLADLEREELMDHKIYVTSPDDRLLALYSGSRSRSIRGKF